MTLHHSLAVLALFTAAACSSSTGNDDPEARVQLGVLPADVALGDTARITIDILNTSDRAVEVAHSHCNSDFVLVSASGVRYNPAEQVYCTLALYAPTHVPAGTSLRIGGFTTGRVIPEGSQEGAIMLPAGTYSVQPNIIVMRGDEEGVRRSVSPGQVRFR